MSQFIERAIERAGLGLLLPARRRGDLDAVAALLREHTTVDLLIVGAIADVIRQEECGDVVRVHPNTPSSDARWIVREGKSELDLLRAIAVARITASRAARIGVDWATQGLEVQQVALGFGATDLTGPMTKKAGDLIDSGDLKKVKGQGMVAVASLRRREIAALIHNAGRVCHFTDEATPSVHVPAALSSIPEDAHA